MLSLDKVLNAQIVLKNIIRESVNGCFLRIEMETGDFDHVNLIARSLRNEGFKLG